MSPSSRRRVSLVFMVEPYAVQMTWQLYGTREREYTDGPQILGKLRTRAFEPSFGACCHGSVKLARGGIWQSLWSWRFGSVGHWRMARRWRSNGGRPSFRPKEGWF